jgi:hypothetical protein
MSREGAFDGTGETIYVDDINSNSTDPTRPGGGLRPAMRAVFRRGTIHDP